MRYAIRPNLNRKDTFTVHKLLPSGEPDYAHAHIYDKGPFIIQDAIFHVNAVAERRILSGKSKVPMASVIGEVIEPVEPIDLEHWVTVNYNPRHGYGAFYLLRNSVRVSSADLVALFYQSGRLCMFADGTTWQTPLFNQTNLIGGDSKNG